MKLKATKKAIRNSGCTIIKIGYCDAQNLLRNKNAFAYSGRREGWACDYYQIGNVIISTGYDPIGQKADYDLVREYDKKAKAIWDDFSRRYEDQEAAIDILINEFIGKVTA